MSALKFRESKACDLGHFKPVQYDSSGRLVACIQKGNKITVWNTDSLDVHATIVSPYAIDYFLFSPDSNLIAVLTKNPKTIQIYAVDELSLDNDNISVPFRSISGGIIEIAKILWSPNSKILLMYGVFNIIMFVFRIEDKTFIKIPPPKNSFNAFRFSPNGDFFAILTRENRKDSILVYDGKLFNIKKTFVLNTLDAKTLVWSHDGFKLLAIDEISHNMLEIINLETGNVFDYSEYDGYLGFTDAVFDLESKIIAVGGFDNFVKLISFDKLKVFAELSHEILISDKSTLIYEEDNDKMILIQQPVKLEKGNEKGITNIKISPTNKYIATTSAEFSKVVFVWSIQHLTLSSVLIFKTDVHQIDWSTQKDQLSILTKINFLYLWTNNGISMFSNESIKSIDNLIWRPDGDELLLFDPLNEVFDILSQQS